MDFNHRINTSYQPNSLGPGSFNLVAQPSSYSQAEYHATPGTVAGKCEHVVPPHGFTPDVNMLHIRVPLPVLIRSWLEVVRNYLYHILEMRYPLTMLACS